MKKFTTLKISAVALCSAAILLFPFFNNGKKYTPRANHSISLFSNFAGAAEYYHWLKQNPATGKIDLEAMAQFQYRKNAEQMGLYKTSNLSGVLGLNWNEMGPDNIGGRCRAILVDKNNVNRLFAGGVSAGLFRSNNGGSNWTPINDQLSSLIVSCIAQDASGNIYFGTGEGMARMYNPGDGNSSFTGGGMFKMDYNASTDSYSMPSLLPNTFPAANTDPTGTWSFINRIKCSPVQNSNGFYNIYAGVNKGLYYSLDGGTSWTNALPSSNSSYNKFCTDVDVANDGSIYAAIGGVFSGGNKIFYSAPASSTGQVGTFANITPPTSQLSTATTGRIEIAVSPSRSNIIYATVAGVSPALLTAAFQSTNNGTTWSNIGSGSAVFLPFADYGQGDYDHVLEVFPDNPYSVILGGTDLFRWDQVDTLAAHQGIGQWTPIANQFASPFNPTYVHADKHAITFDPSNSNKIYIGCDGGVFRTSNRCATYTAINNGFNATQFYSVSFERDALWNYGANIGKYNSAGVFGGAQDNGTQYINGNGNTTKNASLIGGGDGFYTEASMLSPEVFFTTSYYGFLSRTASRSATAGDFYPDRKMIACGNTTVPGDYAFASFVTPIALWESSNMTNSPDSIEFIVDSINIAGLTLAPGGASAFNFIIPKPHNSTIITASTLKIIAGTQTVTCTAGGTLGGSGTGTYSSTNDSVSVVFSTAPALNTPIKIVSAVSYISGSQISVTSNSVNTKFSYVFSSTATTGDTVMIQDIIQSRLAVGLSAAAYLCVNPLNFTSTPKWIKIAGVNSVTSAGASSGYSGTIQTLSWGGPNCLYLSNTAGVVFRITGLASVIDSTNSDVDSMGVSGSCVKRKKTPLVCEKIASFTGNSVTSISTDPTNPDRVIITIGNYGLTSHVYYCTTGTTCPISTNTSNFTSVGTVDNPVYSSIFVQTSHGQLNTNFVLIGTEDGVYSIDLSNQSAGWQSEKGSSFPNVPTFMLKQQRRGNWESYNSGIIYAGTHGRGFWQATNYYSPLNVAVPEITSTNKGPIKTVKIFPNPANNNTTVSFNLNDERRISISVYDLKGSKIKTVNCGILNKGVQNINLELEGLSLGTYIVSVSTDNSVLGTCRFMKID